MASPPSVHEESVKEGRNVAVADREPSADPRSSMRQTSKTIESLREASFKEEEIFGDEEPKKPSWKERLEKHKILRVIWRNALMLSMVLSMILAVITGALMRMRPEPYTDKEIFYTQFIGNLFTRSLRVLLIPYITACVISAVGRVRPKLLLKLTLRTVLYFLATTILAALMGLLLGLIFPVLEKPIVHAPQDHTEYTLGILEVLFNLFLNLVPYNIVFACMYTENVNIAEDEESESEDVDMKVDSSNFPGTNYMGIYIFSVFIGLSLYHLGHSVDWVLCLADTVRELMRMITYWVLWISPIGLFFLLTGNIIAMKDISKSIALFHNFLLLFIIGTFAHCIIVIVGLFLLVTRSNPLKYIFNILWGLFTTFATGTSVNAIPFNLYCVQDRNHVDPRVAQLVIPFGANINMDGRALYIALISSCICNLSGIKLTASGIAFIFIFSIVGSVDISPNDRQELPRLIISMLSHMGIDTEYIENEIDLLFSFVWLLDRIQSCANVFGDALGAKIINVLNKKDLSDPEEKPSEIILPTEYIADDRY